MDTSVLDEVITGRVEPHIYAFKTNTIPNYLKVGDTYRPVAERLQEWKKYFPDLQKEFDDKATVNMDIFFRDYAVHQYLEKELGKIRLKKTDIEDGIYYSNEFFKEAEKADIAKSAFLANMSHEIGTPLNAIVGFSGILASTEEEEEKQEYVSIIENNNTLLLQLISDILDLSKIEAGTLDFNYSNVEINDLMSDLKNSCQLKLKSDKVKLEFIAPEQPCCAYIEKNRLSQLIINFVTNAIKFTTEGSIRFGFYILVYITL